MRAAFMYLREGLGDDTQQKDKRQQPQVAMGNGAWVQSLMKIVICSAGAGAEGSFGISTLRDT